MEKININSENIAHRVHIEIEPQFSGFAPIEFKVDPLGYFERKGTNIKSGEIQRDEAGVIKEDPTAVKDLPVWRNKRGEELCVVGKRVNIEKSHVGKSGDPFYEYEIMKIAQEFFLPAPKPIAKAVDGETHLIVMEKISGFRWVDRDAEAIRELGLSEEDKTKLIAQAQQLMNDLQSRFEAVGLVRTWKMKDMIFDVDFIGKKVRSVTPTDWERTKVDKEKLLAARSLKQTT